MNTDQLAPAQLIRLLAVDRALAANPGNTVGGRILPDAALIEAYIRDGNTLPTHPDADGHTTTTPARVATTAVPWPAAEPMAKTAKRARGKEETVNLGPATRLRRSKTPAGNL